MNIDISQNVIHVYIKRVKEGVKVNVKVSPEVEEFFQYWGHNQKAVSGVIGRVWKAYPIVEGAKIEVWALPAIKEDEHPSFDLYSVGRTITTTNDRGQQNISFIRIVGASQPDGANIVVEDIVSRNGLLAMGERIDKALSRFYDQYIRPAGVHVNLQTRIVTDDTLNGVRNG